MEQYRRVVICTFSCPGVCVYSSKRSVFFTVAQCSTSSHQIEMCTTKPKPWVSVNGNGWSAKVHSMCLVMSLALVSSLSSLIRDFVNHFSFWGIDHATLRKFSEGQRSSCGKGPMAKSVVGCRWTVRGRTLKVIHLVDHILPCSSTVWASSVGTAISMQGEGVLFGCAGGGMQVRAGELGDSLAVAAASTIVRITLGRK